VTAELVERAEEFVEDWEVELEALPPLPVESFASDAAIPDVGVMALGDLTLAAELAVQDPWGELPMPQTTLDEIGFLFGADGAGLADIGDGLKAASFFGARSRGEEHAARHPRALPRLEDGALLRGRLLGRLRWDLLVLPLFASSLLPSFQGFLPTVAGPSIAGHVFRW